MIALIVIVFLIYPKHRQLTSVTILRNDELLQSN